jgi:hypothetical protein
LYERLKLSATILLPAIGALYFALAQIWHFPVAAEINGTIAVINTFVGTAVMWLKSVYKASGAAYNGVLTWEDTEDGAILRMSGVDNQTLTTQDAITFKIVQPAAKQ